MTRTDPAGSPEISLRPPALRVERRAIAWWTLRNFIACGIPLGALIAAALIWEPARPWLFVPMIAAAVVLFVMVAVAPLWRYRVHRWEVTDRAAYGASGWFVTEWRVAPVTRIQTVDAVRGPLEQLFGLATLRVTTASSYGAINVCGLDRRTAEEASRRLALVAEVTGGDAT